MYEYASTTLPAAGFKQYEISNWCRPGKECHHNLQYWRNQEYLGVGAGAHGFSGGYRYSTIAAPERYIAALRHGPTSRSPTTLSPAVAKSTLVGEADDLYETIMMGMRLTKEGINRARFRRRFGCDILERFAEPVERMLAAGLLTVSPERICLSQKGRLLSNGVIRALVDEITL
jgi:oxygen-independent coproporphyrinogen-3 oxidase